MENTGPGTLAVLSAKAGNLGENAIIKCANRSVNWGGIWCRTVLEKSSRTLADTASNLHNYLFLIHLKSVRVIDLGDFLSKGYKMRWFG